VAAYRNGEFAEAAKAFATAAAVQPAAGTYVNLGLAEWERGRSGHAVLAWERALWIDSDNPAAQENLRFAREQRQLEAPSLAWHEVASAWLPFNVWAWLAGASLWLAVGMITVPPWLRWRRAGWHQAVAAAGLAVFLMCVPAMLGLKSRQQLVIVLERNTPLRLTPTADAQWVTVLSAGDPARVERSRGSYVLIRASTGRGWVERAHIGGVCGSRF
jgi:tetratricopeptide (TPR) repeat protein